MRLYILFLSTIFLSHFCFAQPEKVRAKIITGIMAAQIDGDRLSGYDKPGLVAGMAMELKLGKKFSVQPEIIYCQKGARSDSKSPYYAIVRLNYIDMAATINFYLKEKLVIQPGFSYGLLYRARVDNGGGFVSNNSFFNQGDFCYLVSVEYKFAPKTAVSIRYAYSLTSISPITPWYNNTLSFTLRFTIGD